MTTTQKVTEAEVELAEHYLNVLERIEDAGVVTKANVELAERYLNLLEKIEEADAITEAEVEQASGTPALWRRSRSVTRRRCSCGSATRGTSAASSPSWPRRGRKPSRR